MGGLKESIVASCDKLLLGRVWEEVASQLLSGEAIKWHVFVKGANDIVAIRRDVVILIAVVTNGVGVADEVEPVACKPLSKVRRSQETIDFGLDGNLGISFKRV